MRRNVRSKFWSRDIKLGSIDVEMVAETEEGPVSLALSAVREEEAESKPYRSLGRRDVLEA